MRDHFVEGAGDKYDDMNEKLRVIWAILREGWIEPAATWKLQGPGVAFGDALAQKSGLIWMIVEDEYGRAPTLKDPESDLNINAITMISKRPECGESPDVLKLSWRVCDQVEGKRRQFGEIGQRDDRG